MRFFFCAELIYVQNSPDVTHCPDGVVNGRSAILKADFILLKELNSVEVERLDSFPLKTSNRSVYKVGFCHRQLTTFKLNKVILFV